MERSQLLLSVSTLFCPRRRRVCLPGVDFADYIIFFGRSTYFPWLWILSCGNVASILELDEYLAQEYKVFQHAPSVGLPHLSVVVVSPGADGWVAGRPLCATETTTCGLFPVNGTQLAIATSRAQSLRRPDFYDHRWAARVTGLVLEISSSLTYSAACTKSINLKSVVLPPSGNVWKGCGSIQGTN